MTEEDKKLLLKTLCETASHGVKGLALGRETDTIKTICLSEYPFIVTNGGLTCHVGEQFKPYLRSMDSMTEDEKSEFETLKRMSVTVVMPNGVNRLKPSYVVDLDDDGDGLNNLYDWLNINHFDFRGLIKKGLAVEAPDGIYRKSNNNK